MHLSWPLVAPGDLDLFWKYHEHFRFGWISQSFRIVYVADRNHDTLIKRDNYLKIFFLDCFIFKTMSRTKLTTAFTWVQLFVETIQIPIFNSSGHLSITVLVLTILFFFFKTITKGNTISTNSKKMIIKSDMRRKIIISFFSLSLWVIDFNRHCYIWW